MPLKGAGIALGCWSREPRALAPRRAPLPSRGPAGAGGTRYRDLAYLGCWVGWVGPGAGGGRDGLGDRASARAGATSLRAHEGSRLRCPGSDSAPGSRPPGAATAAPQHFARAAGVVLARPSAGRRLQPAVARLLAFPAHPALAPGLTPRATAPAFAIPLQNSVENRVCASGATLQDHSLLNCSPCVWDVPLMAQLGRASHCGPAVFVPFQRTLSHLSVPTPSHGTSGLPGNLWELREPSLALECDVWPLEPFLQGREYSAHWHLNSCVQEVRRGGSRWQFCLFLEGIPIRWPRPLGGPPHPFPLVCFL